MFMDAGTGDFSDHNMDHGAEALGNEAAPHEIGTMFDNGDFVIKSPNDVHGHDTFVNGQHVTHTEENVFGGSNIYHGHHLDEVTMPNVYGGMDVYDGNMQHEGSYMPNVQGGEDYLNMSGNGEAMMRYSDPLAHANEYSMNPFDVNKY